MDKTDSVEHDISIHMGSEPAGYITSITSLDSFDGSGSRIAILFGEPPYAHSSTGSKLNSQTRQVPLQEIIDRTLIEISMASKTGMQALNGTEVLISGIGQFEQLPLLKALLVSLKKYELIINIETDLNIDRRVIDSVLGLIDYWTVVLRNIDNEKHILLTGKSNINILENVVHLDAQLEKSPVGEINARYIVIPRMNDDDLSIQLLGRFLERLTSLNSLEIIPFGTHQEYEERYLDFDIFDSAVRKATLRDLLRVRKILLKYDFPVKY